MVQTIRFDVRRSVAGSLIAGVGTACLLWGGPAQAASLLPVAGAPASPPAASGASMLRDDAVSSAVADLRVDANRDGFVDRRASNVSTDVAHKDHSGMEHGALMLPNIDDDERRCPLYPEQSVLTGPTVKTLVACNDSTDDVVNGAADEADLATAAALPMPTMSDHATAQVSIQVGAQNVRVFVKHPTGWTVLPAGGAVPVALMRQGLQLGVEAKDVRRPKAWNGLARLALRVTDGARSSTDSVTLRVAPALIMHHRQEAETVWYYDPISVHKGKHQLDFGKRFVALTKSSGSGTVPRPFRSTEMQYVQDYTEPLTVSMPRGSGVQSMTLLPTQRPTDDGIFHEATLNSWRGPNMGLLMTPFADEGQAQLSAGGNIEAIPPYTSTSGKRWPHGRLLMGRIDMGGKVINPDKVFPELVQAQGVQGPALMVNTAWLAVGHVDEVVSFIPADTPRGWKLVIADPRRADALARQALLAGAKRLVPAPRSAPTLQQYFSEPQRKNVAMAIREVDRIEAILVKETGLKPHEIVRVPVAYEAVGQYKGSTFHGEKIGYVPGLSLIGAALPNAVNSQLIGKRRIVVPQQFGPTVKGKDIFMEAVLTAYRQAGLTPVTIDDRHAAWLGGGDVHCSTSVWRVSSRWWAIK